jgi:nitroimidazol reductase NimA-like FMN-containing flavoprotein (pyridoxamine 5'-phosphate oxidase superfamily)
LGATLTAKSLGSTERTTLKRSPERAKFDRAEAYRLLDSQWVAHVGVNDGNQPYVVPMAYARDGDRIWLHGSRASRVMSLLAEGVPSCVTVTALDAIVVARSGYESSMNYRSVMILGKGHELRGEEVAHAIDAVINGLIPTRSSEVRPSTAKELAATMFIEIPLDEMSMKVRTGPPDEPAEDHKLAIWGGVLPVHIAFGEPIADEWAVKQAISTPTSIKHLKNKGV